MKLEVQIDLKDLLVVVKGISKKTGKPYQLLGVSKQYAFNQEVIETLKNSGVKIIDYTKK